MELIPVRMSVNCEINGCKFKAMFNTYYIPIKYVCINHRKELSCFKCKLLPISQSTNIE